MSTHALLSALYIYLVKSLRGLAREAADVEPWGSPETAGGCWWTRTGASSRNGSRRVRRW